MPTIAIQDKYIEVLTPFGNLQESVDAALQRYTIEKISIEIAKLKKKDAEYQKKYEMEYSVFAERIAEDEEFLLRVEKNINKMWEIDLADWEFSYKGIDDWKQKLQSILMI